MKKFMAAAGLFTFSLIMSSMLHAVEQFDNKKLDNDRDMLKDISPLFNTEIRLLKDVKKYASFRHTSEKDRDLGLNYRLVFLENYGGGYAHVRLTLLVNNNDEVAMFKTVIYTYDDQAFDTLANEFRFSLLKNADVSGHRLNCIMKNEKSYARYESDFAACLGELNQVKIPEKIQKEYELLRNPLNNLVYGSMCSASGARPEGRVAIDKILKHGSVKIMENIMRSASPEGRMFAIQGLFAKNIKSLLSKNRYRGTIDKILKLGVPVNVCMGCQFDKVELDAEKLYREVNGNLMF